ncbi:hypothetical protein TIFTF001_038502 [Ficus carica]|uniref:Uncharacterized protein n=1 Tax=Ficus carica TaxID=3494 RepID=A0AA88E881_FICCA|nr:hypothetical protein TIFTF001_038502 [Ficus carica]
MFFSGASKDIIPEKTSSPDFFSNFLSLIFLLRFLSISQAFSQLRSHRFLRLEQVRSPPTSSHSLQCEQFLFQPEDSIAAMRRELRLGFCLQSRDLLLCNCGGNGDGGGSGGGGLEVWVYLGAVKTHESSLHYYPLIETHSKYNKSSHYIVVHSVKTDTFYPRHSLAESARSASTPFEYRSSHF